MAITMVPGNFTNEYWGLSTDEKPTVYVPNGSIYYEIDTGDMFIFDAEHSQWIPQ